MLKQDLFNILDGLLMVRPAPSSRFLSLTLRPVSRRLDLQHRSPWILHAATRPCRSWGLKKKRNRKRTLEIEFCADCCT
jgi:hypothetical protein